ncbi:potassium/sodium hyperpolarization-activated cyclic nucleotide-gated channel 1 [Ptiloglossa arizonensis]|uniref:potassium/sodium hyperpolarization-activated cyclic nucleotide-gated channel 1 n=1 Tax=Ptiloglossa arizonensis TaxID=3350558 RepID=UPI003F9F9F74
MEEHVCELPHIFGNEGRFTSLINLKKLTLSQVWTNLIKASGKTPRSRIFFDNWAALSAERRRHETLAHPWIIHPFSLFRFIWDVIMSVIYLIAFLTIPFLICFIVMAHDGIYMDEWNLFVYAFCWLDIIFNCVTGYNDRKSRIIEMEPWKILKYLKILSILVNYSFEHYLCGFLLVDILSSLPWDRITLSWRRTPGEESNHIVVLINLLPLLKLLRYGSINFKIYELFTIGTCCLQSYFDIMHFYYQMLTMLMFGFYLMFWFSCMCYLIPVLVLHFQNTVPEKCTECWMLGSMSATVLFRFLHSLFMVIGKLSAAGYGLYLPETDGLLILSTILMVMGTLFACYVIVILIQIKAGRMASKTKFLVIMNQVVAYARHKQLPLHMKNRLLAYYQYRFRNSYFHEKSLLANLSESLRQEIALQSSHRLVKNVAIFNTLPKHILRMIVKNLKFELYLPNDVIVKAGAHGDCMFFLSAGTVSVLTHMGKEICHLEDGAHFGEVALLVPDQRRVASVIAIEVCEVYRLDRRDFRKCIAVHTELFANIERIATERLERVLLVEKQYKRNKLLLNVTTDTTFLVFKDNHTKHYSTVFLNKE